MPVWTVLQLKRLVRYISPWSLLCLGVGLLVSIERLEYGPIEGAAVVQLKWLLGCVDGRQEFSAVE